MSARIIAALVVKDFRLFFRNRAFAVLTALGFVFYLGLYFFLPGSVDENLKIAVYPTVNLPVLEELRQEGLEVEAVASEDALKKGVTEGEYLSGVSMPADIAQEIKSGKRPVITVYFPADVPAEVRDAVRALVRELGYMIVGQPVRIEASEIVLGPDMLGRQIPPRDRLRPLVAVVILLVETMGLATLIGEEIERGTIQALLATPASIRDLFAAKGLMGVGLAFAQSALFMVIVGGFSQEPLVVLAALFLGALLATGVGFLVGSVARDMLSAMPWLIVAFFPLIIPTFGVLFPGVLTGWVKLIPSYYLVDAVHRAANFGSGFADLWQSLLLLLAFDATVVSLGVVALQRRFR